MSVTKKIAAKPSKLNNNTISAWGVDHEGGRDAGACRGAPPRPLVASLVHPRPPSARTGFVVTVYNNGQSASGGLFLADAVPASIVDATFSAVYSPLALGPPAGAASDLALAQISLGPGASATFTITGHVDPALDAQVVNVARLLPPDGDVLSATAIDTASAAYPEFVSARVQELVDSWANVTAAAVEAKKAALRTALNATTLLG